MADTKEPFTPTNQVSFNDIEKPVTTETPRKGRTPYAIDEKQNAIRHNLGHYNNGDMFLCDIAPFLSHYGPCKVEDESLQECLDRMVEEKVLRLRDGKYIWKAYPTRPKNDKVHEDAMFAPFATIVDSVMRNKKNSLKFHLVPRTELSSDIRGSTHKIDACYIQGDWDPSSKMPLPNREVKLPVEVKKNRHRLLRAIVHLQILGACHHIMNEDPRRMWLYALTFESSMVSVWFFSRSHSVKSVAFDWIEKPKQLVELLLCFANASLNQLGVDPTIHVGPVIRNRRDHSYIYEVEQKDGNPLFFKTGRSLVPQRPLCIAGRTTRVWEVTQVTSIDGKEEVDGTKAILKDVWLDAADGTVTTEADNMEAIFKAVDAFVKQGLEVEVSAELGSNPRATRESLLSDPKSLDRLMMQFINRQSRFKAFDDATKERLRENLKNKKYRTMFLTKLHDWQGQSSRAVGPTACRYPKLFYPFELTKNHDDIEFEVEEEIRGNGVADATVETLRNITQKAFDVAHAAQTPYDEVRQFAPKKQSRFIYKEICTTLQNLDTVGDVVDVLCQTIDVLHILFAVGWVHRDISATNIMAFRANPNEPWSVKLADLEFSRLMIDENRKPKSDPRTGTPFFMPVEIATRQYLSARHIRKVPQRGSNLAAQLNIDKEKDPVGYNYLSRVIDLPVTTIKIPPNPHWDQIPTVSDAVNHNFQHDLESIWWILVWVITCRVNCEASASLAKRYFPYDINDNADRRYLITSTTELEDSLHEDLEEVGTYINPLRRELLQEYFTRSLVGHLKVEESYSNIHATFATQFRELQANNGPWRNVKLQRPNGSDPPPPVTGKHRRDEEDDVYHRAIKQKLEGKE